MSEWQLIETAPRNAGGVAAGPFVLLFCRADYCVRQGRWVALLNGQSDWYDWDAKRLDMKRPTHWMPLPSPPPKSE